MNYIPTIIEPTEYGERAYDIFSRLLKDRIVFLGTEVNDRVANAIVAQLLFLDKQNDETPIQFWINSPGGVVTAGMAIYDTMQHVNAPVHTLCLGQACSMGALLLCAGEDGKRASLPNSRIMIHQPLGGSKGQVTDILIAAEESKRIKDMTANVIAYHTKKDINQVHKDTERDNFMSAQQALDYGIVDEIINRKER